MVVQQYKLWLYLDEVPRISKKKNLDILKKAVEHGDPGSVLAVEGGAHTSLLSKPRTLEELFCLTLKCLNKSVIRITWFRYV